MAHLFCYSRGRKVLNNEWPEHSESGIRCSALKRPNLRPEFVGLLDPLGEGYASKLMSMRDATWEARRIAADALHVLNDLRSRPGLIARWDPFWKNFTPAP
jgi:hypothetical protein